MAILHSFLPVPPEFSNCFFFLTSAPAWVISSSCRNFNTTWVLMPPLSISSLWTSPWIQTHVSTSLFCLMSDMSLQLSLFHNWAPDFLFLVSLTFPVSLETSRVILSAWNLWGIYDSFLWHLMFHASGKSCQLHLQNMSLCHFFFSLHLDPPWSKPPSSFSWVTGSYISLLTCLFAFALDSLLSVLNPETSFCAEVKLIWAPYLKSP